MEPYNTSIQQLIEKSNLLMSQGKFLEAIQFHNSILSIELEPEIEALFLIKNSIAHFLNGSADTAFEQIDQAIIKAGYSKYIISALTNKIVMLTFESDTEAGINYFNSLPEDSFHRNLDDMLLTMGMLYQIHDDMEKSWELLNKYERSRTSQTPPLFDLAEAYFARNTDDDYRKAFMILKNHDEKRSSRLLPYYIDCAICGQLLGEEKFRAEAENEISNLIDNGQKGIFVITTHLWRWFYNTEFDHRTKIYIRDSLETLEENSLPNPSHFHKRM